MKTHDYLYKSLSTELSTMFYKEALEHKIEQADLLITELLCEPYQTRDAHRIAEITKAINFNKQLLNELKEIQ